MLLKLLAFVFVALVFIGLGSSGTLNAAVDGYHTVTSNPIVHQLQSKATGAIISAANQFHNIESTAVHTISST
ncbi:MAG TPA: hypothetical protein VFA69_08775 [Candidatus Nitrosotalea sp.]|nr:hypothetical protein [Candidatus Nitrosotalea sp.]